MPPFHRLPEHLPVSWNDETARHWQIELCGLAAAPLAIEIVADVVLGIACGLDLDPDLDLSPYGGETRGVSQCHVLLRPTWHHLFIIDLDSTQGTQINDLALGAGVARELQNGDHITLGKLTFTLRLMAGPLVPGG